MSKPPQTNLVNYQNIPHLEAVLLWFLEHDNQIASIQAPSIQRLFKSGYRPISIGDNDPKKLQEVTGDHMISQDVRRWLVIRIWLDLVNAKKLSEQPEIGSLEVALETWIDYTEKNSEETLIKSGAIASTYNVRFSENNFDEELGKIPTNDEREIFKQNYLADELTAAEVRILAWIYKELFGKDYKVKK